MKVDKTKMENRYIFPDFLTKLMSKVDMRTQYEASMLSMTLMSIGLVITIAYVILYLILPLWYKIVLIINGLAGIMFMWSYIVTTYQQYKSYMDAISFQEREAQNE